MQQSICKQLQVSISILVHFKSCIDLYCATSCHSCWSQYLSMLPRVQRVISSVFVCARRCLFSVPPGWHQSWTDSVPCRSWPPRCQADSLPWWCSWPAHSGDTLARAHLTETDRQKREEENGQNEIEQKGNTEGEGKENIRQLKQTMEKVFFFLYLHGEKKRKKTKEDRATEFFAESTVTLPCSLAGCDMSSTGREIKAPM